MSLTSLNIASRGLLDRGDTEAITIAVRGFLRGAIIVPPIPEQRPPGGGSSKRRRRDQVRVRIISLREKLERARKAKDAERIEAARVEALALAEAEGLKTEALRRASTSKQINAAIRALTKQVNSELAIVRRNTEDSRKAREQAIKDEQRRSRLDAVLKAEEERQAALLAENEDIAIALLLVA